MPRPLYIYGASGHGKVVLDLVRKAGNFEIAGFLDDGESKWGTELLGFPILGGREYIDQLEPGRDYLCVAIGNNKIRRKLGTEFMERGFILPRLVHPSAQIAMDVIIESGTVVMAGAVVNTSSHVGPLCILNTCCSVDHDVIIGEAVHICPGVRVAGSVKIGDESWIGIGTSIIENRTIGSGCLIGAGAAVVTDLPDKTKALGVPARSVPWVKPLPKAK